MAPVNDRPFLELLLDQFELAGIHRVILAVGHLHEAIEKHFGTRYRDIVLDYSIEETLLGTGGAARLALTKVCEARSFVVNGDTLVNLDYQKMNDNHISRGYRVSMAVCEVDDISRYGQVVVDHDVVTGFVEKRSGMGKGLINAGVYLMDRDLLGDYTPWQRFSLEAEFLASEVRKFTIGAFRAGDFFLDIGIPEDYRRAQLLLGHR
jgi:D-glycero-alpha-D-manno-heptose 1-phosphate guanylyltransferase